MEYNVDMATEAWLPIFMELTGTFHNPDRLREIGYFLPSGPVYSIEGHTVEEAIEIDKKAARGLLEFICAELSHQLPFFITHAHVPPRSLMRFCSEKDLNMGLESRQGADGGDA